MDAKADIVGQHRIKATRMPLKVLLLDLGNPIEACIEDRVHDEAHNVQGDKVKVEPNHALSLKVRVDLRVKRDGPRGKVDPSHDIGDAGNDVGHGHCDSHKYALACTVGDIGRDRTCDT